MAEDRQGQRILVVDDEPSITDLVSTALRFIGYSVETAASGREALLAVQAFSPHLVVLDVMLPDIDGFEVCRRLRASNEDVPVIFLTARGTDGDKIAGLDDGGDDYVTKPFSLEELTARIRAVLRRTSGEQTPQAEVLRVADLELDPEAHRVTRGDRQIDLSPTEFKLLRYLLMNAGKVMGKDEILEHVWHFDFGGNANVVETYISYLRRKIDTGGPRLIQTIRGFGYTIRNGS